MAAQWPLLVAAALCWSSATLAAGQPGTTDGLPAVPDLSPGAVTMKSWTSLKESLDKIEDQVRQVALVKDDVGLLQEDLLTQDQMWQQAAQQLQSESAKLQNEIQTLRAQVEQGVSIKDDVQRLRAQNEDAKLQNNILRSTIESEEEKEASDQEFMRKRVKYKENEWEVAKITTEKEVQSAQETQRQTESDYQAFTQKAVELEDRLSDSRKQLPLEKAKLDVKTHELGDQLARMQEGLHRMQEQLIDPEPLENEIASLKSKLEEETMTVAKIKQEEADLECSCNDETKRRVSVLNFEGWKKLKRDKEAEKLCMSVRTQHKALEQSLFACEGQPQISELQ